MTKGFTLLESLVALTVLSVSVLGVYSIVNSSLRMTEYSKVKLDLADKGYERLLIHIHYPGRSLMSSEHDGDTIYSYTYSRKNTLVPSVSSVDMKISNGKSVLNYVYFERSK